MLDLESETNNQIVKVTPIKKNKVAKKKKQPQFQPIGSTILEEEEENNTDDELDLKRPPK